MPARTIRLLDVADLTGADRLAALRDAIENDLLDEEVRYAALERYLAIVEKGEIEARANGLVHAIETFCDPAPSAGDLRIAVPTPGELIVAAPADAQAWIDDFLASMRTFGGLIDVDLVVFNAPSGTAEDVWDGRTAVVLDEGPTRALLQRLEGADDTNRVQAPRITTFPAQPATMEVVQETPYIKDYEFTVLPGQDGEIADPVVDVVRTGTSIDMLAIPLAKERVAVEIQFSQSSAEKPYEQFVTTLGRSGAPVTIQLPEVKVARVDARFELGPGQSIALSVTDPKDADRDMLVVLRARRVERADPRSKLDVNFGPVGRER